MRASSFGALIAVLAATSSTAAHSWIEASVVGTIVPGTVRCGNDGCAATVRMERVVGLDGGRTLSRAGEVGVTFARDAVLDDRARSERWPDLQTALLGIGSARVRLQGDFDTLDGHDVLMHTTRVVRMRSVQPAAPQSALFPACGHPPWSQATLERCSSAAPRTRRVTVSATLESAPFRYPRQVGWAEVLDVEDVSVKDMGLALEPPSPYDTVFVPIGARFVNPKAPRLLLHELRAGDRIAIGGVYELPLPHKDTNAGWHCFDSACSPRLVVDEITLVSVTRGAAP